MAHSDLPCYLLCVFCAGGQWNERMEKKKKQTKRKPKRQRRAGVFAFTQLAALSFELLSLQQSASPCSHAAPAYFKPIRSCLPTVIPHASGLPESAGVGGPDASASMRRRAAPPLWEAAATWRPEQLSDGRNYASQRVRPSSQPCEVATFCLRSHLIFLAAEMRLPPCLRKERTRGWGEGAGRRGWSRGSSESPSLLPHHT